MQSPPLPSPSSVFLPFSWKCAMYWSEWKINFPIFIFRVIVKIIRKLGGFEYKNNHNSKNKNRKYRKMDFWFVSAHYTSFMYFWRKKIAFFFCLNIEIFLEKKIQLFLVGALPPTKKCPRAGFFFKDWWTLVGTG